MSKRIEMLTDQKIMQTVPGEKPRKLFDGAGLYVTLLPSGSKIWRMKYRDWRGKEMTLTFGHYPEVSIELARHRSTVARQMLKAGQDPRTQFDHAHIRSPTRLQNARPLPVSIDQKTMGLYAGRIGRESLDHMGALVFPAALRLSADGSGRSEVYALFEKVQSARGKAVVELLYDIRAEVVQKCLDAGVDESVLIAGMTDARMTRRRLS